jgi:hypothetical protein
VQFCDAVIHRELVHRRSNLTNTQSKKSLMPISEVIIEAGPDSESGKPGMNIKQDREQHSGVQTLDMAEDLSKYEILEAHLEVDINDDGINEQIIVWVNSDTGQRASRYLCPPGQPRWKASFR